MPAPATSEELVDLIRKSGVVDDKRLNGHLEKLRARSEYSSEAGKLAAVLVKDTILTKFQAEQFLQGRWKRFTVGKYKVLDRIASGGMGSVYLCEHKFMRRLAAVKVLPTSKANDPSSLERFYREARAVAALDHPNIVRAYDIDEDDGLHFLVMEYVDGLSLQELVRKSGPLDPARAAHYISQAAIGLQHAHDVAGLVHRDIKPGNLIVDRGGTVKVLDMGLARFFYDEEDLLTQKYDENVLGTADYLAPEQALDSHSVDNRADIYSLGATFYFCLTGRTPFNEGTVAQKLIWHQTRQPKSIGSLRPDVPTGMIAVVEHMMAKDPNQRYQQPAEVTQALIPWTQAVMIAPTEGELPNRAPAQSPPTGIEPKSPDKPAAASPAAAKKGWEVKQGSEPARPAAAPPAKPADVKPARAEDARKENAGQQPFSSPAPPSPAQPQKLAAEAARGTALGSEPTQPQPARPQGETRLGAANAAPQQVSPLAAASVSTDAAAKEQQSPEHAEAGVMIVPASNPEVDSFLAAATSTSDEESTDERLQWEQLTVDLKETPTLTDGRPRAHRKVRTRAARPATSRQIQPADRRRLIWILTAFAAILLVTLVLVLWLIYSSQQARQPLSKPGDEPPARTMLYVTQAGGQKDAFKSISEALKEARPGTRIIVQDSQVEEFVDWPQETRMVTLEAEAGKIVTWRPPANAPSNRPLIAIQGAVEVRILGLVLDGGDKLEHLVTVSGYCPGLLLERLQLRGFAKSGIILTNCTGNTERRVNLANLDIVAGKNAPSGLIFDVPAGVPPAGANQFIVTRKCRFEGPYRAPVQLAKKGILKDCEWEDNLVHVKADQRPVPLLPPK